MCRCSVYTPPSVTVKLQSLGDRSFYKTIGHELRLAICAIGLGPALTDHSIRFDSIKSVRHLLAQDFSRLFSNHKVPAIERQNPAAAMVAVAANWVLGCQEVLQDQQRSSVIVLELLRIAAGNSTVSVFPHFSLYLRSSKK